MYQEYGDPEILRRAYPSMAAYVREIEKLLDARGLWRDGLQRGDWLDPPAPGDDPSAGCTDKHLVGAAYFARTAQEMAETARLERPADEGYFTALAARTRAAFRAEFVTANGRVTCESATAYALALCFGLLDQEQEQHAGDRLVALFTDAGFTITTGFAGTPYVLPALSMTGPCGGGVPAAVADGLPVLPLSGDHGRRHDLGTVGRAGPTAPCTRTR